MQLLSRVLFGVTAAALVAGCGGGAADSAPPAQTSVFLAGDRELWVVDPAAATSHRVRVPELSAGDPPHRIAVRGDRLVLWGYDTWSVDARDPASAPERIARDSWIWIPSMNPDRVWVGFLDPNHTPYTRPLAAVREIDAEGKVTVPDAKPPAGAWPEVALTSGLIVTQGDQLMLWDPRTERVLRRFGSQEIGSLGPAFGNRLASCVDRCKTLVLTDFATGNQRSIQAPTRQAFELWHGAFSPDGATIGVPIRELGVGSFQQAARRLALISLDSETVELIPGSAVSLPSNVVVWSEDGSDVYLIAQEFAGREFNGEAVIISHSPGDEGARRTSVEAGPFYDATAQ